jgi:hypothetical protein
MKSILIRRPQLAMLLVSGAFMQISCGLTQRDISGIAQTALTTALTSALQLVTTGLLAGTGAV